MQVLGVRAATILLALTAAFAPERLKAEDISIVERSLPGDGQRPQAIVVGPNGNLWVTEVIKRQIFRISSNGDVTAFRVPGEKVGVLQGITSGPDGNLVYVARGKRHTPRFTRRRFQWNLRHSFAGDRTNQYEQGIMAARHYGRPGWPDLVRGDGCKQDR